MLTEAEKQAIHEELERQLAPLMRATERAGGSTIELRESQARELRFLEAARRQDARESEREAKSLRKQSRKVFESLGFSKKAAKRAARAGVPEVPRLLEGRVVFNEEETRVREAQRELRAVERKVAKAERKDGRRIFEDLGLPRGAAKLAAAGRG